MFFNKLENLQIMNKTVLPLAIAVMLSACSGQDKDKVLDLENQVMTLHDEVMPQMEEIMTLKTQLSKKIVRLDSLQNEGITGNALAEERMRATDMNQKLNDADRMMMTWMNEYRGDSAKKLEPAQAIQYLESEKKKIDEVKQVTIKSINDAKSFLNK